jgi:hypothetical protein
LAVAPNAPETIGEIDRRLHELHDRADLAVANSAAGKRKPHVSNAPVFAVAYDFIRIRVVLLSVKDAPLDADQASPVLAEIESRAARLEADVPAARSAPDKSLQERLDALNDDGTRLWNRVHTDELNLDDAGALDNRVLDSRGPLDAKLNAIQIRISALADKLQAVDARLHGGRSGRPEDAASAPSTAVLDRVNTLLTDPFEHKEGFFESIVDYAANRPSAHLELSGPRKTLLDIHDVPLPSAALESTGRTALFTGCRGEDADPNDTLKVDALRARGLTRTVGDPNKRSADAYAQTGNTCAIASQVEVMSDFGDVGAGAKNLKDAETVLYNRAIALGWFEGDAADKNRRMGTGTDWDYVGDLLDRPVQKHYKAGGDELFKSVLSGRMILVIVASDRFWNNPRYAGMIHVVSLTGVELDLSGRPLGYYFNDTGTGEGGRFVGVKQFLSAWNGTFVEPL